jgi:hypothetical protein
MAQLDDIESTRAGMEVSGMAAEETSIQFDVVLLIACHGLTNTNSLQTNLNGTISLKRIEFPSNMKDTKLTIMTASEIGVTTCDYLTLFKERLMSQIGNNIKHKQSINLNQVQKYFRTLKKNESKKVVKETLDEFGAEGKTYMNKSGWNISNQCVERFYTYDESDLQLFSVESRHFPFQILYQNPDNPDKFTEYENIYAILKKRFENVYRSNIIEFLHMRGFKNICIFDISCGSLTPDAKRMLGIEGITEEDARFRRALTLLQREAAATFTAGKRYKKIKRKTIKRIKRKNKKL